MNYLSERILALSKEVWGLIHDIVQFCHQILCRYLLTNCIKKIKWCVWFTMFFLLLLKFQKVSAMQTFKYSTLRRCWYINHTSRRLFFMGGLIKISLGGIRTARDLVSKILRCGGDANYYSFEWRKSKGNVILPVILKFCGPSISQKEISKQKQKYCSYLFVQIRWEEARDYVNVIKIHSLPEPAAGPKILEFSCTQKESVFCVFVAVMSLVKILVFYRCHFYYFFYT